MAMTRQSDCFPAQEHDLADVLAVRVCRGLLGVANVVVLVNRGTIGHSLGVLTKRPTGTFLSARLLADQGLPEPDIRRISFQILVAIISIHGRSCVHRDIRPETVMMTRHGKARLADFGTAALLAGPRCLTDRVGTPWYMAPEFYEVPVEYGPSADMWAFGVLLCDMVRGRGERSSPPQSATDVVQWASDLVWGLRDLSVSGELKSVIEAVLDSCPSQRAKAAQLFHHPFYEPERSVWDGVLDVVSDSNE
jgi:serine/threonine protein kinase